MVCTNNLHDKEIAYCVDYFFGSFADFVTYKHDKNGIL